MNTTIQRTLTVVLFIGVLCAVAVPAAAQDTGEIDLVIEPANATADPGEQQTFQVSAEGPDNGILVFSDLFVELGDPGVANITSFTEQYNASFSNSEIRDSNTTLLLDAFVPDDFNSSAASVTLANITVTAEGSVGDATALAFNQTADPTVVDFDDNAYNITGFVDASLSIPEPPNFAVNLTSVDSGVTGGETVTVDYQVENTGEKQSTQDIIFDVNNTLKDTQAGVTLDGGETFAGQFTYDTVASDAPAIGVSVSSGDDTATETVTVDKPPFFAVSIDSTNAPVLEGDTLSVTALIENTGNASNTQTVQLNVSGLGSDSSSVSLNSSASTQETFTVDTGSGDAGSYAATVTSDNDTASTGVQVTAPANFAVSIDSTNAPVVEGDTLSVTALIENTGNLSDTQTVAVNLSGLGSNSSSVSLAGGESTQETVTVSTGSGDAGDYTATVTSDNDTASTGVQVYTPANFAASISDTNAPVVEGDTLLVTALIENTGGASDTQTVTVNLSGLGSDSSSVSLAGGESTQKTFTVDTGSGDAGDYTATVASDDDTASTGVRVDAPANFAVSIGSTSAPVVAGDTLSVTAFIENTGDASDIQTVAANVSGLGSDSSLVSLAGGESTQETFTVSTGSGDAGNYTATVSTDDDTANASVQVDAQTNINLAIEPVNATADPGEQQIFQVSVEGLDNGILAFSDVFIELEDPSVASITSFTEQYDPTFSNSEIRDSNTTLLLDAFLMDGFNSSAASVTLANVTVTAEGSIGDATALAFNQTADPTVVDSDDNVYNITDFVDAGLSIPEPPNFAVNLTSVDSGVTGGETVTVEYQVENTGDEQSTQDIIFDVNNTLEDTEAGVTLDGGETFAGQFTYDTVASDVPAIDVSVSSENDVTTQTVTVDEPPFFAVSIDSTNAPVVEGDTLSVTAIIENTGNASDTQTVQLNLSGLGSDSSSVSLNSGASTQETFTVDTGSGDAGDYTATVASDDDSESTGVQVDAPANFVVDIAGTNAPVVEGDTLSVTAVIENTGDASDTQTVQLNLSGLGSNSSSVSLNSGASTQETFTIDTSSGDAGDYTATVTSDNDTESTGVQVDAPANLVVDIAGTNAPVVEGDTLSVTAVIENTGDVSDTQTVQLNVSGLGSDSSSVSLAGGASTQETFTVDTSSGDAGDYTATVSTDDDSASTGVQVDAPANFVVGIAGTNAPVVEGDTLSVTAVIENTGDASDTQTMQLNVSGLGSDSSSVSLAGGASTQKTFTVDTASGDAGDYTATVASNDNSATTGVRVDASADFVVGIAGTNAPVVEGDTLSVTAVIENTGDVSGTQTVAANVSGLGSDSSSVSLVGGTSTQETFTIDTSSGDAGDYTATVASEDDAASTDVRVDAPANLAVSIDGTNAPVVEGETLSVTALIENIGDVETTQTVTLDVGALGSTSTPVALSGGESTTIPLSVATSSGDAGNYTATVSTDDDSASTGVTVLAEAGFTVSIAGTNAPVVEGETLSVEAVIENLGDVETTQTITLGVGALGSTSTSVALSGGESTTIPLSVATSSGDAGNYTATVSGEDDSASTGVTVLAEAGFAVSIAGTNSPVVEGETLSVEAVIENTGDVEAAQTITLDVGTLGSTSTSVALSGGESTTVPLPVPTSSGDAGNYTATVSSEDDSASTGVTVLAEAGFAVSIAGTNAPVVEGETLSVEAVIENTGDVEATQTVTLGVGTLGGNSTSVTLSGGESTTVSLSVATSGGDAGNYTATVASEDDSASANVTVLAEANFAVAIAETNAPIVEGETLSVDAVIENTGDIEATQTITLDVGSLGSEAIPVALDGGESTNFSLPVGTESGDAGNYTATVASEDDSTGTNVTVLAEANFAVAIAGTNAPVVEGEALSVDAVIENTGGVEATQTITLDVGSLGSETIPVALDGGESTSFSLSVGTGSGDAGNYTATVASEDDSTGTSVTVLAETNFGVAIAGTNAPVAEGETLSVDAVIENTGDTEATQTVTLDAGALGSDSTSVTLSGGESTTVSLSVATSGGDAGSYTATVASEDDSASADVTVLAEANFAVAIDGTNAPVAEGETLSVDAVIENTGDTEATQTITLDVGVLGSDSTSVTLSGGESTTVSLSVATSNGDAGSYTATVASEDDSASTSVTVLAEANFAVTITGTNAPVTEGETISVDTVIENTGDVEATQTITLDVEALGSDSTSVTLSGGESTTVSLSVATSGGDAGEYTATVASEDDSASTSVTVLAEANFAVAIAGTNAPVVEGETISVDTVIENTGDTEATQTVTLDVGVLGSDSTSVTLSGGESTTVSLSVATSGGDAGEYTATVASEDDSASADVTVLVPPASALSDLGVAGQGDEALILTGVEENVTVNVANTGGAEGEFNVTLVLDGDEGTLEVTETIAVPPGETMPLAFEDVTGNLNGGIYEVNVSTADDTLGGTLTVSVDVNDNGQPASDTTGDNLLNDVDGDGDFDIFDVQTLFSNLGTAGVQDNADLFGFDGTDDDEVSVFDIQALFVQLDTQSG